LLGEGDVEVVWVLVPRSAERSRSEVLDDELPRRTLKFWREKKVTYIYIYIRERGEDGGFTDATFCCLVNGLKIVRPRQWV
jgi:hypothetical protein